MKWFDYNFLSEDECAFVSIRAYADCFVLYMRDMGKKWSGDPLAGLDIDDPEKWKYWKFFKVINKFCDEKGVRYDVFWEKAFRLIRNIDHPYPCPAVFQTEKFLNRIVIAIQEEHEFKFADHIMLKPEFYCGLKEQDEYYNYILSRLGKNTPVNVLVPKLLKSNKIPKKFIDKLSS